MASRKPTTNKSAKSGKGRKRSARASLPRPNAKLEDDRRNTVNQIYIKNPCLSRDQRIAAFAEAFGEEYGSKGADKDKLRGLSEQWYENDSRYFDDEEVAEARYGRWLAQPADADKRWIIYAVLSNYLTKTKSASVSSEIFKDWKAAGNGGPIQPFVEAVLAVEAGDMAELMGEAMMRSLRYFNQA